MCAIPVESRVHFVWAGCNVSGDRSL